MNGLILLLISLVIFLVGYIIYGGYICRLVGIDFKRECPSKTKRDDIDYTPTSPYVLFGHHFASIAGAGPIVGPVLACLFGWLPAMLWIILGCIFVGTVHDFSAMFLSVRNEGRSIAFIIEKELGFLGRQLFLIFCLLTLILVVAVFTIMVTDTFIAAPAAATSSILFILMAPFFAVLTHQKLLSLAEASIIFVPLLFLFIWLGTVFPMNWVEICGSKEAAKQICPIFLIYYTMVASVLPVWFLLQPRDYLNSYLLLAMIVLSIVGICIAQPEIAMPAFVNPQALFPDDKFQLIPDLLPLLFVTIACGACSGFHSLVASGTSSKQLSNERHMRPIAMGAMYMEGILAVLAVISVGYLSYDNYHAMYINDRFSPAFAFASGLGHFLASTGIREEVATNFISLAISAFMLTSLDTCMRLARFIWHEFTLPSSQEKTNSQKPFFEFISNRWMSTIILGTISSLLIFCCDVQKHIWPIFGSANQLLAAITLMVITLWLYRNKKNALVTFIPTVLMYIVSVWSLVHLVIKDWNTNIPLAIIAAVLVALALTLIYFGYKGKKAVS